MRGGLNRGSVPWQSRTASRIYNQYQGYVFPYLHVEFRPPTPLKSQSRVAAALDMGLNRGFIIPPALTVPSEICMCSGLREFAAALVAVQLMKKKLS